MTKRELIDEIAATRGAPLRHESEALVEAVFDSLAEALAHGERIEIRGFGIFIVRGRRERVGRNPRTGDAVAVHAKRVPFFKAGKELKLRVDSKGVRA
jgi:integration host factor subunit beta